jgi:outer membrane biosynthesis protein TonB
MARANPARSFRSTTRRGIARDTLTILGGALLAVVAAQLTMSVPAGSISSPTPPDTGEVIGGESQGPGPTFPPLETIGQIVNPSVHLEATPTPIPIITLGPPTPSPSESASPDASPTHKPTPTPRPTATRTPAPTRTPAATAAPTPVPAVADFSCVPVELTLSCTDSSSNASSWTWDWGDGTSFSGAIPPPHSYGVAGSYRVTLTVTPLGPSSVEFQDFDMTAPVPT